MKYRKRNTIVDASMYGDDEVKIDGYILEGTFFSVHGPVPRSMDRLPAIKTPVGNRVIVKGDYVVEEVDGSRWVYNGKDFQSNFVKADISDEDIGNTLSADESENAAQKLREIVLLMPDHILRPELKDKAINLIDALCLTAARNRDYCREIDDVTNALSLISELETKGMRHAITQQDLEDATVAAFRLANTASMTLGDPNNAYNQLLKAAEGVNPINWNERSFIGAKLSAIQLRDHILTADHGNKDTVRRLTAKLSTTVSNLQKTS